MKPGALRELLALAATEPLIDLGWLRVGPLRLLLASLFDPPVGAEPLSRATRFSVECCPHATAVGLLLAGWVASRVGWEAPRRADAQTWRLRRKDGELTLRILAHECEAAHHGIRALELESEGDNSFALRHAGPEAIELTATGLPTRVVAAPDRSDPELLVAALGLRGRDPLLAQALRCAVEIDEA
jgi:glucose-6-phosphate dehydrogenase assembly protein OpcA